jgi:hypothetical protein
MLCQTGKYKLAWRLLSQVQRIRIVTTGLFYRHFKLAGRMPDIFKARDAT